MPVKSSVVVKTLRCPGYQGSAEVGIEEILLGNFPGCHFPSGGSRSARLAFQIADVLPRNDLLRRRGAHRKASHGRVAFLNFEESRFA